MERRGEGFGGGDLWWETSGCGFSFEGVGG